MRLGRGRHSGAVTYINDAVYELVDILHLKRRAVGSPPGGSANVANPPANAVEVQGDQQETVSSPKQKRSRTQVSQEPKDVASAVISGRMHACETNHDLDKKYPTTTGLASSKSISAITLGTKSRGGLTSSKLSTKKKRLSSKYKRSRKGGPRVYRLLYANGIVPFIHLPVRLFKARGLQEGMSSRRASSLKKSRKGGSSSSDSDERRSKKARFTGSGSNSSGGEGGNASVGSRKSRKGTSSSSDSDERRSKKARFSFTGSNSSGGDGGNASVASGNKSSVANALLALRSGP